MVSAEPPKEEVLALGDAFYGRPLLSKPMPMKPATFGDSGFFRRWPLALLLVMVGKPNLVLSNLRVIFDWGQSKKVES